MSETPLPIRKAVIPAAGRGTRLLPATKSQPKEMLPVGRKPVIHYVVEEMIDAGLSNLLIVTGRTKRAIEDHIDTDPALEAELRRKNGDDAPEFPPPGAQFFYVRQSEPRGLGHAVLQAEEFAAGEPFVVALGDSIVWSDTGESAVERLMAVHLETGADATIAVEEVPARDVVHYGIVQPRGAAGDVFPISDIVEKPSVDAAPSRCAVAARYVFGPRVFDALRATPPGHGGEIQLTDAIRALLRQSRSVWCVRLGPNSKRYDIGNFEAYYRAFVEISLRDPELGEGFRAFLRSLVGEPENRTQHV